MPKIVLATIGTLGDLHPFIAIGQALQARGCAVVLAVPQDHVAKCQAAGIEAVAVVPTFAEIAANLGMGDEETVRRVMTDLRFMIDQVLLPSIGPSAVALDAAMAGADAVVASSFMLAAPVIAEKHGLPLIDVVLQPMSLLSVYDPPKTADFWMYARLGALGVQWNRLMHAAARRLLRRRYAPRIDALRAAHGLAPSPRAMLLDPGGEPVLTLCCYSPLFGPLPPDAPSNAIATGFAMFDSESGAPEPLDPGLAAFLDAGAPPLVFTLGSFAVYAPGDFYATAAALAHKLGRRAVLLAGEQTALRSEGDVFVCAYAPHSALFPRAAIVIHHGGAGTTGQALRAGKPQLVVPHMGDQYDHAHRIQRMGIGLRLDAARFTLLRAEAALAALNDPATIAEAARVGALIRAENGAAAAADAIVKALAIGK